MSERGSPHPSERENNCWRSSFLSLGFTAAIGAHSISEEFAGFYPLWFPRGKLVVLRFILVKVDTKPIEVVEVKVLEFVKV